MPFEKFLVLCSLIAISVPAIPLDNNYSSTKLLADNYDQGLSLNAERPRDQSPHRGTGRREMYQGVAIAHF